MSPSLNDDSLLAVCPSLTAANSTRKRRFIKTASRFVAANFYRHKNWVARFPGRSSNSLERWTRISMACTHVKNVTEHVTRGCLWKISKISVGNTPKFKCKSRETRTSNGGCARPYRSAALFMRTNGKVFWISSLNVHRTYLIGLWGLLIDFGNSSNYIYI